jgi:F-type H+-transporting ATPase subunit gamma
MEVVSMTKMRKSQQFALAARPYALASLDMLKNILKYAKKSDVPAMLRNRTIHTVAIVVITTDKGLVGGFNDKVIALAEARRKELAAQNIETVFITIGKKAREYFERRGQQVVFHGEGYGDHTSVDETQPITNAVLQGFIQKKWDAVYIVYTHFKTTLRQEALERTLLPTTEPALEKIIEEIIPEHGRYSELKQSKQFSAQTHMYNYSYTFEPSAGALIEKLISNLLHTAMHHIILESNASEHSARMVTMKNASDNAKELKERLTLEFNKVRQASITAEISEIVAGAEALQ